MTGDEAFDRDEIPDADDTGLGPVVPCWYAGNDPGRIWPEPPREPFRWPQPVTAYDPKEDALVVPCPECKRPPGSRCITLLGVPSDLVHRARARAAAAGGER